MSLNFDALCKWHAKYFWIFSHVLFQIPKLPRIFSYLLRIQSNTCRLLLFSQPRFIPFFQLFLWSLAMTYRALCTFLNFQWKTFSALLKKEWFSLSLLKLHNFHKTTRTLCFKHQWLIQSSHQMSSLSKNFRKCFRWLFFKQTRLQLHHLKCLLSILWWRTFIYSFSLLFFWYCQFCRQILQLEDQI